MLHGHLSQFAQAAGVVFEESLFLHLLFELSADGLVIVAEDGVSEVLDLRDDVPGLVLGDVLHDVLEDPLEHDVSGAEVGDELVDGKFLHLGVVESDAEVGGEVELAGHIAQHTLEEGVDGLDAEIVVVVEEVGQCDACTLADEARLEARLLADGLEIVAGVGQLFPDAVELTENTHLHLLGGLVGEGDSEDVAITEWIIHEQADILGSECESLATACAGFID